MPTAQEYLAEHQDDYDYEEDGFGLDDDEAAHDDNDFIEESLPEEQLHYG